MDLILKRTQFRKDGIFSELLNEKSEVVAYCLEHSYRDKDGRYLPKIPDGTYECVRGWHRLHGMDHDFETFEITGIPGHSKILFHVGNFNDDSDGCVLVGSEVVQTHFIWTIVRSRMAFQKFFDLQGDNDKFMLLVSSI